MMNTVGFVSGYLRCRANCDLAKAAMMRELTCAHHQPGGVRGDGMCARTWIGNPGRALRPSGEIPRSKVAGQAEERSPAKAKSPTVRSVVAMKWGNAHRAKGPCQRHFKRASEAGAG
jgi:hypothetical protein